MTDDGRRAQLIVDVRAGLGTRPYTLPAKYFYDGRGSELFDEITRLPEYYPTRAERGLLSDHADQIAKLTEATTMIELGSGTSEKTRLLLDALITGGTLRRFVPLDVDPSVLAQARRDLAAAYPSLDIDPVVGDFDHDLVLPTGDPRLVAFLGSTIGNFEPRARGEFLQRLAQAMGAEDFFLLGTDLVKSTDRLLAAYNDSRGVTAAFNRNVLAVIGRELEADLRPDSFDHVAAWDEDHEWIEMRLRSRTAQVLDLAAAELRVPLAAGEEIRTEISAKFRREGVETELVGAGFEVIQWWDDRDFGLSLSKRLARIG